AIDRLPRQMRAAVMLRFFDDMTEPEVAAALGVSVGTVKSTVARAVAKLRKDAELGADSLPSPRAPSLVLSRQGVEWASRKWATRTWQHHLKRRSWRPGDSAQGTQRGGAGPYGQHDDGLPADDHHGHALRHHGVRRQGGRHLRGGRARQAAQLRGRWRAGGPA